MKRKEHLLIHPRPEICQSETNPPTLLNLEIDTLGVCILLSKIGESRHSCLNK